MGKRTFDKFIFFPLFCIELAIVILGIAGVFSCNIGFAISSFILYNILLLPILLAAFILVFFHDRLNFKLFITVSILQLYPFILLFLTKYFENDDLWSNVVWSIYLLISIVQLAIIFRVKKFNIFASTVILLLNFAQCVFFLMMPS